MLRLSTLVLPVLLATIASAQDCSTIDHITRQFQVSVETGVLYGVQDRFDGGTDSLRLDIYKPVGDEAEVRPLLIAIHGGAFISGDRSDMNEVCQWYAERGYVAATVSYRLGFHSPGILPIPYAYDQAEVVRAAYRAQQDVRGAIRFLLARHAQDSSSTENVFVYGVSAGAIAALHATYARDAEEKPLSCGAIAPADLVGVSHQRPDLGPLGGTLNMDGDDVAIKACVSYLGAQLDTTFVDASTDAALFTYHQDGDPVVGCHHQQALWGMPLGVSGNYPWLFGSCVLDARMQNLGYTAERYEFHPFSGNAHDIHDIPLVDGWAAAFLARQFCGTNTALAEEEAAGSAVVLPNPASDHIEVRLTSDGDVVTALRLYDIHGRLLRSTRGSQMEVADLPSSMYLLTVVSGERVHTTRLSVAH